MTDALLFAVASFAVYRVSRMVGVELGPFHAFERFRGWAASRFGAESWIAEGVACPLCLSFWFGFAAAAVIATNARDFGLLWLGVSGAASFLYRLEAK